MLLKNLDFQVAAHVPQEIVPFLSELSQFFSFFPDFTLWQKAWQTKSVPLSLIIRSMPEPSILLQAWHHQHVWSKPLCFQALHEVILSYQSHAFFVFGQHGLWHRGISDCCGAHVPLCPKEYALLHHLLLCGPSSKEHLLQHVWSYPSDLATRTFTVHIHNLRKKLEGLSSSWTIRYTEDLYRTEACSLRH